MKLKQTDRGFGYYEFNDRYNTPCTLQKSSLATENAIWIGLDKAEPIIMASKVQEGGVGWVKYPIHEDVMINTRMHLTQDDVKELLPIFIKFAETGEI